MLLGVIKNIFSGSISVFKYATESVYRFPNPQYNGLPDCGKISLKFARILALRKSGVLSIISLVNERINPSGDINKGPSGSFTPSKYYKNYFIKHFTEILSFDYIVQ